VLAPNDLENRFGRPEGAPITLKGTGQLFPMCPIQGYARDQTPLDAMYQGVWDTRPGGRVNRHSASHCSRDPEGFGVAFPLPIEIRGREVWARLSSLATGGARVADWVDLQRIILDSERQNRVLS